MTTANEPSSKVTRSRERMRAAGLRPVQFWVPDTRLASFAADLRRQCLELNGAASEAEALGFTEEADLNSLVLCPVTSDLHTAAFRVTVEPTSANGLRVLSQVMVDKLSTVPRIKVSEPFGRLEDDRMRAVDKALLLVVGLI